MINEYKNHSKYLIPIILTVPLLMAFYAYVFFETSPTKKQLSEAKDQQVAGASTQINIADITSIIPILPEAEISSFSTSNGNIALIMETLDEESDIKNFYEDFFFKNNWQQIDKNTYQKGLTSVEMEISGNIVKARISKSPR